MTLDVVLKITIIIRPVRPRELPSALLPSINVISCIATPIWPLLFANSMLLVFYPISFICSSIQVLILSLAMGLIVFPLSLIDISICVDQSPLAVCFIVEPLSIVSTPIWPDLSPLSLFDVSYRIPLSFVLRTVLKDSERNEGSHNFGISWSPTRLIPFPWVGIELLQDLHDNRILKIVFSQIFLLKITSQEGSDTLS